MVEGTKSKILEVALKLFSQNGYLGTSMSDIAAELKITKPALYKHYASKHEILECIIERMNNMDVERAEEYEMPSTGLSGFADAYMKTSIEKIRAYSMAQFRHWTEEEFSSQFRKMLTIEQYRDEEMSKLYQNYLAIGPVKYMKTIFRKMTDSDEDAMQLALDFYGPMYLLYGIYDEINDKQVVLELLNKHIERFILNMESRRGTK